MSIQEEMKEKHKQELQALQVCNTLFLHILSFEVQIYTQVAVKSQRE